MLLHISRSLDPENVNSILGSSQEGWELDSVELVTSHSPLQDAHIKLLRAVVAAHCISSPVPYMLKPNLSDKKEFEQWGIKMCADTSIPVFFLII